MNLKLKKQALPTLYCIIGGETFYKYCSKIKNDAEFTAIILYLQLKNKRKAKIVIKTEHTYKVFLCSYKRTEI